MRAYQILALAALLLFPAVPAPAEAASQGPRLIRDAEIESIIRSYAAPLFQAAGLNPNAIDVYLIQDRRLNAFVTAGMKMFINTGLLMRSETPLQVIGVIAHETGHIAGGHIVGRKEESENALLKVIATQLLGIGAAIATGRPEAGIAVMAGGQDLALKDLLSYSRGQEQAADQAAVRLLEATGQSPIGLVEFMQILGGQEILLASNQDPYLRTHPLSYERVAFAEQAVRMSPYADAPPPADLVTKHARMRAKLIGFLEPASRVFQVYPKTDQSVPARYARAIVYLRAPDLDKALPLIDDLLAEQPKDPFFHELKGQMLFESGRVTEALPSYEAAVRLKPDASHLRQSLAQIQIEMNTRDMDRAALVNLDALLSHDPNNPFAWRLASNAHGRLGEKGMTSLALAESALARRHLPDAREQAARAQRLLPKDSPAWLRAQDVANEAERLESKKR